MSVEVHLEWKGRTELIGRLHSADRNPSVSFEYDRTWLEREGAFSIDPTSMPLQRNSLHSASLFGAIQDAGPDRWGRMLIDRAVRKKVLANKPFHDLNYVLALDDAPRIGALRFRHDTGSPFLAPTVGKIPPLIRLSALLRATEAIHTETETAEDLRFLLGAGSPLGGARPKSAVTLPNGQLAIAKFPKPDDPRDIAAGEILALTLAAKAGIDVAGHQLIPVKGQSVAVITRFDRDREKRIPFLSASTLTGLPRDEVGSYTLIAEAMLGLGDRIRADLCELWRRMAFSLLASNFDDHFRNHGFLMRAAGRWALSPAYDINPMPESDRFRCNKTPIAENQAESTIEGALSVAEYFGLESADARAILRKNYTVVSDWRKTGRQLRLPKSTLDAYESAFDNPFMDEARRLLGK